MKPARFQESRALFHCSLVNSVLRISEDGIASNADKDSSASVRLAKGIADHLNVETGDRLAGQISGNKFEIICADFVDATFRQLDHLRPGAWRIERVTGRSGLEIAKYAQYQHLVALDRLAKNTPELAAALGSDYTITPDIIVARELETDAAINASGRLVDDSISQLASLRAENGGLPLLHASISCKWTIRSDRVQNSRSEGLNLVRNRKGHLPHVVVITAEPTPSRLASIALGTGEIDCVYHFALYELQRAVASLGMDDASDLLAVMVEGKRLKDISDLPLDLAL